MKTTLELPERLVMKVKLRALRDNRKLKDMVAELLEKGLALGESEEALQEPVIEMNQRTGGPIIRGGHAPRPGDELTNARIAEILFAEELTRNAKID